MKVLAFLVALTTLTATTATPIPADTKLRVTRCSMSSMRTDVVAEKQHWVPKIINAADIDFKKTLARSPPHDCNATVIGSYYNGFVVIPYNLTTHGSKLTGASKM
ncbi:hypothetical protein CAJCM15448_48670 [Candidozyma auris]|nr:hypothetical protein CAJCM15448_48670 [[Candida] auris]